MQINASICLADQAIDEFVAEILNNLPECSMSLKCIKWDYKNVCFEFIDPEDDEGGNDLKLTLAKAREGFEVLMRLALEGKFYASGWDVGPLITYHQRKSKERLMDWAGDWDATVVDALVQCSLFGDVIYG